MNKAAKFVSVLAVGIVVSSLTEGAMADGVLYPWPYDNLALAPENDPNGDYANGMGENRIYGNGDWAANEFTTDALTYRLNSMTLELRPTDSSADPNTPPPSLQLFSCSNGVNCSDPWDFSGKFNSQWQSLGQFNSDFKFGNSLNFGQSQFTPTSDVFLAPNTTYAVQLTSSGSPVGWMYNIYADGPSFVSINGFVDKYDWGPGLMSVNATATASVANVPIPASLWLMGSALVGLLRWLRRNPD